MIFNGGMSIWILAFLLMTGTALAGWRQGAIRAAFSFVGILVATLLAMSAGKLLHPILTHVGLKNPIIIWALSPVSGFILISIIFKLAARPLHNKTEHFYKYQAGDLRLSLWERLNSRLGICLGLMNGALYFVLITFFIFNLTYWTNQIATTPNQPVVIRLANQLGRDLEASGLARAANAVGHLPPTYYQLADLAGFLVQNPQTGPRLAEYPALTSLWEREDMQALVTDATLTNALANGASLGEIFNNPNVQAFLANKEQTKMVMGILQTNLDDLSNYLKTGKSATYDHEKIIGRWEFNPAVTIAWLRQNHPKIPASEMRSARAWMTQAYAQTRLLATGDNQFFIKNLPRIKTVAGQPPTTEYNDWKGDWSPGNTNYDLHVTYAGEEKFMSASAENLRLSLKDGKNLLIFDRAD
jgi:Colicin V production protein